MTRLRSPIELPLYVDIYSPKGLASHELAIQADHVVPFSRGGQEENNLKLAHAWCNSKKAHYTSAFEIQSSPVIAGPNRFGLASLPKPFWTVRTLATRRRCEHSDGCDKTLATTELRIALRNSSGAPVPSNLTVLCGEHDTLRETRFQTARVVKDLWQKAQTD